VASAVFDHLGQPVAAIGMTYRTEKIDTAKREILIEAVKDSASKLTARIGGHRP
jgi:DNA-binding IclR family transcriptional regulator